ncbi:PREDICTED: cellulose synthase-like protein H1 isoform X2 [Nelumbo nucifera]|uniref:Cellulose synthase-like protein H1 isoform X2 n=1 Tax=Nelumbo nucifera TaxID=4432 RepID=A0A1U7YVI2_NELNU|nr:PREDICTED: cellulose synthase-like protein H1 isoform X2 [Nelumbo nucifera]
MANPISLPLQQRIPRKNILQRVKDLIIFLLLLSLLLYRFLTLRNHGVPWLLAFLCESWFTFIWVLNMNIKWNQFEYRTYPERLLQRGVELLPPVDIFVTTADPVLEPPIITVNTVLSLLALDYPANKLACYISDDGASPLTFFALVEASKFAKLWVPFCKKYDIRVRAPSVYFSGKPEASPVDLSSDFGGDWKRMKIEYEQLKQRIEEVVESPIPCDLAGEFAAFSKIDRRNHPSIVKVIWENKGNLPDGLPHLVYVSREKRPKHPHHNKAGAMNVLTRVSGVMTNSPFMLNVDCDMFANDPQTVLHAVCLLFGFQQEKESAYVQFPQAFYGTLKDDPFGNQLVVLQEFAGRGIAGIQGPLYAGTGCFHRRKVIYGLSPDEADINLGRKLSRLLLNVEFMKSASEILAGVKEKMDDPPALDDSTTLEAAIQVASCGYERDTYWGTKVGWVYGSTTEDVLTGLKIHSKGWNSVYMTPDPPAFLGSAPSGGPACMTQQKRWATGLFEVLFNNYSPILPFRTTRLMFRQRLAYLYLNVWSIRSVPELCYALLPSYAIFANKQFLPTVSEAAFFLPVALFITFNLYTLSEFLRCGLTIRAWWNNQRMARIISATAWLFGLLGVILKLLGLSETTFEITRKDQDTPNDSDTEVDAGVFTFDESPIFVPGTALLLVHMTALAVGLLRVQSWLNINGSAGYGLGEIICSIWVVLSFLPFLKGLFRKGIYGIPTSTIYKSAALALLFVHLSLGASKN